LIRNAEKEKIPVMAVVGAKEMEANSLNVRVRAGGDKELGAIPAPQVIDRLQAAIVNFADF
jgi:threonyl-tRNA synthetase